MRGEESSMINKLRYWKPLRRRLVKVALSPRCPRWLSTRLGEWLIPADCLITFLD
jgi:hypothetical protein